MMTYLRSSLLSLTLLTMPLLAHAQRGEPVVSAPNNVQQLQSKNAELTLEVSELKAANARLTGRLETVEFELRRAQQANDALAREDEAIAATMAEMGQLISDMQAELVVLRRQVRANAGFVEPDPALGVDGTAADPADSGSDDGATPTPPSLEARAARNNIELPADAESLFDQAMNELNNFNYENAEISFRAFLDQYGETPRASEAQYWLGEVLYQQESHAESGAAYTEMIRSYPDDPRAPEALVKLARSMRLVGEMDGACRALAALPQRYPSASSVTNNLARLERSRAGCDS